MQIGHPRPKNSDTKEYDPRSSRHEFWCEKHASLPSKVEIAGVDCHCNGAAARCKRYRTSPPSPLTSMLMAEHFVFHPFGEELKINIEDGGPGGGSESEACVLHIWLLQLFWTWTVLMKLSSLHLRIRGLHSCKPSLGTGPLQSLQLSQNKGDAQRRQRARQKTQITMVHSL